MRKKSKLVLMFSTVMVVVAVLLYLPPSAGIPPSSLINDDDPIFVGSIITKGDIKDVVMLIASAASITGFGYLLTQRTSKSKN